MRVPISTYRLQFNRDFTFQQATAIAGYLADLGISECYASPVLLARPGSQHGYDVIDHTRLNPEIGTAADFAGFATALRELRMGLIMDVVPNHMCIADSMNRWWSDVLENGPSSGFAKFFDIDWHPPKPQLENKVLYPVLGQPYGKALEDQQIQVRYQDGGFFATCGDFLLPLAPRSFARVLQAALDELVRHLKDDDPAVLELESILLSLSHLPAQTEVEPQRVKARQREQAVIRRRLRALIEGPLRPAQPEVRRVLSESIKALNGQRGDPRSFDALEALLAEQVYRLSFWRVAAEEINYRRFFDVNDLAAIRVEEPLVFQAVHALILRFIAGGLVTGLRIDHVDGLFDPRRYLDDLQEACRQARGPAENDQPFYVVVEKILAEGERLPADFAACGTTGYDFASLVNGLFVDREQGPVFSRLYRRLTGFSQRFSDVVYESKKLILQASMSSELHVLSCKLDRISEQHRMSRDFTRSSLKHALLEVVACFPVYRSYVRAGEAEVSEEDRRYILAAVRLAKARNPVVSGSIFDFIASVLLRRDPEDLSAEERRERLDFVMRFQQLTGPVMAKGVEDTAFYRYYPLASLCEVGGDAQAFGTSVEHFHRRNQERLGSAPHSLLATSTHDTKRSEDVRARIDVLSEVPEQWESALRRWREMNRPRKVTVDGMEVPGPGDEYLLYQTLVGVWPMAPVDSEELAGLTGRIKAYMFKAIKEAKLYTSWINPNGPFEEAVQCFVGAVLQPGQPGQPGPDPFLSDLAEFAGLVTRPGLLNSLSQTILKATAPGVPDFYQGTELWDFSLVDPDNRRQVDFGHRRALLGALQEEVRRARSFEDLSGLAERLLDHMEDGRIKLYLIHRALGLRQEHPELFARGSYLPLSARGAREEHAVAFARALHDEGAVTVAARFFIDLGAPRRLPVGADVWGGTWLALPEELGAGAYRDVLTGRRVLPRQRDGGPGLLLAEVFAHLPVALLERI